MTTQFTKGIFILLFTFSLFHPKEAIRGEYYPQTYQGYTPPPAPVQRTCQNPVLKIGFNITHLPIPSSRNDFHFLVQKLNSHLSETGKLFPYEQLRTELVRLNHGIQVVNIPMTQTSSENLSAVISALDAIQRHVQFALHTATYCPRVKLFLSPSAKEAAVALSEGEVEFAALGPGPAFAAAKQVSSNIKPLFVTHSYSPAGDTFLIATNVRSKWWRRVQALPHQRRAPLISMENLLTRQCPLVPNSYENSVREYRSLVAVLSPRETDAILREMINEQAILWTELWSSLQWQFTSWFSGSSVNPDRFFNQSPTEQNALDALVAVRNYGGQDTDKLTLSSEGIVNVHARLRCGMMKYTRFIASARNVQIPSVWAYFRTASNAGRMEWFKSRFLSHMNLSGASREAQQTRMLYGPAYLATGTAKAYPVPNWIESMAQNTVERVFRVKLSGNGAPSRHTPLLPPILSKQGAIEEIFRQAAGWVDGFLSRSPSFDQ